MKKILTIDVNAQIEHKDYPRGSMDGVRITYDDGSSTEFGIESGQHCCESWNYLHSVDDPDEFIGAKVLAVEEVDTWPDTIPPCGHGGSDFGFQAIRVTTDRGLLDFVVYNEHNGYYSHSTLFRHDGRSDVGCL